MMNEDVLPPLTLDKAESLIVIEPLNGPFYSFAALGRYKYRLFAAAKMLLGILSQCPRNEGLSRVLGRRHARNAEK